MDSNGLRQYALERANGFIEVFSSLRLLGAVIILLAIGGASGCIVTRLQDSSKRPVETGMEVFVRAEIAQHTMDCICVFPFSSPPEMAAGSYPLTSAFQARLVQRGPFRLIKNLPYGVKSDSEAIWYARSDGLRTCDDPIAPLHDGWIGCHAYKARSPHPDTGRTHVCSPLGYQTDRVLWTRSRYRP